MTRAEFLNKIFKASAFMAFPAFYSWQIEPFWVEFVHKNLPIKNLPESLEGKILMQISDLHVGDRFDWNFLIESFQKAKTFNPDFVVYTGDYVNKGNSKDLESLKEVMRHAVKGNLGTIGILGNHDYYGNHWSEVETAQNILEILESNGVRMLRNQQTELFGLNFIGFDDLWSPNFNPMKVMKDYNSSKANLVLCHNPDVCDLDIWNGYQDWILSGHTHGGQCRIPGVVTPLVPVNNRNYIAGEVNLQDGRMLYVNRALGHSFQVRFMVRPEISVFKLLKE